MSLGTSPLGSVALGATSAEAEEEATPANTRTSMTPSGMVIHQSVTRTMMMPDGTVVTFTSEAVAAGFKAYWAMHSNQIIQQVTR